MILYKTKDIPDTRDCAFYEAHRYVLDVYKFGISWTCQGKLKSKNEYRSLHADDTGVEINSNFSFGFSHVYYDGPHCSLSLGWVHFRWNNFKCKKCYGEE
jgi:hypothetical protein